MTNTDRELNSFMTSTMTQYETIIIGLGKTGYSCVRFLAKQGKQFAVVDNRNHPPELDRLISEFPEVNFYSGEFDSGLLASAKQLIISPGVSMQHPAIRLAAKAGVEIIGDIELFARHVNAPVVAVTGSNGKSTVVSLVSSMISAADKTVYLGGNFGTPALSFLEQPPPDFYVLELSSFQLETVSSLDAAVAVVLNISADHMDRYADIVEYATAKQRIYAGTGCIVINKDEPRVVAMTRPARSVTRYTLHEPVNEEFGVIRRDAHDWLCHGKELLVPASEMLLKGRHNISNALAALAIGYAIGLPMRIMTEVLKIFTGLPHRCEWVTDSDGVTWINDSKGTNPGASCAAIEGLSEGDDIVLIAGGDGKGADFSLLAESVMGRVHAAVLIGRDANQIAVALKDKTAVYFATTLDAAVKTAARLSRKGDKVLLSPACASFDMFRDYQDRGQQFIESVIRFTGEMGRR